MERQLIRPCGHPWRWKLLLSQQYAPRRFYALDSRDDKALESRVLLCSAVVGDRAHYEENVFHAVNQDHKVNGEDSFSGTPEGRQTGWNYWVERITDRLYWLGNLEITLLGLLGVD